MITALASINDIPDYTPQIMGVIGTILGTIIGWLLQLISNNLGKTHFFLDFYDQKSNGQEYAYIVNVFIYNASYKQQCIRNVRISFRNEKRKVLFESRPSEGDCNFSTIKSQNRSKKNKIGVLSISGYAQIEFTFSGLLSGMEYNELSEVRNIYLLYENKRNRTKKALIQKNFDINNVNRCESESFI